ncbi:unnamed protein product [Mytilus coruscus]|uniref:Integrase catalytic domain-containing protein n=1 Tax=Mytilus coruscus TaxID=42192 RepID=A0A6J8DES6_MYTCO|nr:unnamed protein product [Mytilus coruscus]
MLISYVNKHQNDGDEHLPYVFMAYRSSEHETTGNNPNYLMLGREITTPLDIQYAMPRGMATIPQNKWTKEIKERMEEAHLKVNCGRHVGVQAKHLTYETCDNGNDTGDNIDALVELSVKDTMSSQLKRNIPKIKTTPRSKTQHQKCPWCPFKTLDTNELKEHLIKCGMDAISKRYTCTVSNKVSNVKRHKKVHNKTESKVFNSDIDLS